MLKIWISESANISSTAEIVETSLPLFVTKPYPAKDNPMEAWW